MAAARFRQARDTYKILCKQDPQKFLPGLIEANSRLAEEMMQKGMISEAEAVLTYLKTIAPSSSLVAIEISFALKKNDWQSAWNAAVRLRKDATAVQDERYKAAVADALVLAFPSGQEIGSLNLPEASELAAIVSALRCVSEERWEQAQELLRPIPRGSLFAAWKIFVKGMIAFYTGDLKKAETLFAPIAASRCNGGSRSRVSGVSRPRLLAKIQRTWDRTSAGKRMPPSQFQQPRTCFDPCRPVLARRPTYRFLQGDPSSSWLPIGATGFGRRAVRFLF